MAETGKISAVAAAASPQPLLGGRVLTSGTRQDLRGDSEAWFQAIDLAGDGLPFMEDGRVQPFLAGEPNFCSICDEGHCD